ncbi:MAG: YraN family protein [Desulfamplus sp.]|nr:YraN family protein [Desulfamplus sp.]
MSSEKQIAALTLGAQSEDEVCRFIEARGYLVLERNYRTRFAEIDIIAHHGDTLVFIEVKSRSSMHRGSPAEAVGIAKQKKITAGAMQYIRERSMGDIRMRFDVATLIWMGGKCHVELYPHAFRAWEYKN